MKRCPKCNTDNTDNMNFCVECGTPLGEAFADNQQTAIFPNSTPTNSSPMQPTQPTVVTNFEQPSQPTFQQSPPAFQPSQPTFQTPQPTVITNQPSYTPPPSPNSMGTSGFTPAPAPPKKSSKMIWIVGGVVAVLILGVIGVVGIGALAIISQSGGDHTPTPTVAPSVIPTKTSPVPSNTPGKSPTVAPTTNPPNSTELSADYDDMNVDFNVTEGGQKGMRMHVSFTTRNMKNVDSYLAIYFQKSDGTPLDGKVAAYRSKSGQVAVFKLLRPAFDVAEFKDQQLFVPYTAFSLPPGKYNLQMVVNIIYKTDGLIQHLHDYDFEFEQK